MAFLFLLLAIAGEVSLLTPAEVAELLRLPSVSALYELRRRGGAPPATLVGRQLRWRAQTLERWLNDRTDAEAGAAERRATQ